MRPMEREEGGGPGHVAMGVSLITLLRHEGTSLGFEIWGKTYPVTLVKRRWSLLRTAKMRRQITEAGWCSRERLGSFLMELAQ